MVHSLFSSFQAFAIDKCYFKKIMIAGFEPGFSLVSEGIDRSANCATTTALDCLPRGVQFFQFPMLWSRSSGPHQTNKIPISITTSIVYLRHNNNTDNSYNETLRVVARFKGQELLTNYQNAAAYR